MNKTTSRYPRTTTEAFSDADRAGWVQGPYRHEASHRVVDGLMLVLLVLVLLGMALRWI